MNHDSRIGAAGATGSSSPSEAWLFAQALLGNSVPSPRAAQAEARAERERLEWLAGISDRHADELRRLQNAEAEARRQRAQLEWLAAISTRHEEELRRVLAAEAQSRQAAARHVRFVSESRLHEAEWHEADHPRQPKGVPTGGQWVAKGGGGSSGGSVSGSKFQAAVQLLRTNQSTATFQNVGSKRPAKTADSKRPATGRQHAPGRAKAPPVSQSASTSGVTRHSSITTQIASDPSHWYLPSDDKGTWLGKKGKSTFRLKTPVEVNGRVVREIKYFKNVPVLDTFAMPGKTATIILTGHSKTDIRNAKIAWQRLNPGRTLPKDAVFHHDLLHVVEETLTIDGKKTKVLVGKMQLVPTEINRMVFHEGSASVARKFYEGLNVDTASLRRLAKYEASAVTHGTTNVAKAAKRIVPGKIAKGILPLLGRNVVRAIPIFTTGLAILEFSDNVEAHGVDGAVARAVPVLGDLISTHDLGSDLAKQIIDDANAARDETYKTANAPVTDAWHKASEQTVKAFHELAPQIQVTNTYGPNGLVDPHQVGDALRAYRDRMGSANYLRAIKGSNFDFDAAAASAKQELRTRLIDACQKGAPRASGPTL